MGSLLKPGVEVLVVGDTLTQQLRFLIVEDHPLVRDALEMRLRGVFPESIVAYSGGCLAEAITAAADGAVACAILDLDLGDGRSPVMNTCDLVEAGVPVLIVSALADPATVRAALHTGALGFVSKQASSEEFEEALRATVLGQPFTSHDVAAMLCTDPALSVSLSERERTAMILYASGMKIESVARRMNIKPATAGEYIKRVREKYQRAGTPIPTKTELYRRARSEGLVP